MKLKKIGGMILCGLFTLLTAFTVYSEPTRVSVHDPSIVKLEDESYYIIGSHLAAARSKDLINWNYTANSNAGTTRTTFFNNIYTDLQKPMAWSNTSTNYDLSGNLWAPDILWNPVLKKYCMYLSVNGDQWHSSIVLCTADNIDGPYKYVDTIVYSGFETKPLNSANSYKNTDVERVLGNDPDLSRYLTSEGRWNAEYGTNAIDPCVFYDEEGKLRMVYGSWFGGIFMLELDENTGLRDYNVVYETKNNASDAYMGKKVAGGHWASGEGPYIEYMCPPGSSRGYYYLFLSYGYFHPNGGYNMRIYRSSSPEGPYVDEKGNSAIFNRVGIDNIGSDYGVRLMSNYKWSCNTNSRKAQGHNSVIMDDDGKLFVVYHTKFGGLGLLHEVRVNQLIMNEDGWLSATAYEYKGESLSKKGHTLQAIAGDYEFIIHSQYQGYKPEWSDSDNNDTVVDIATPISIKLTADGKVSGDKTGTWTVDENSPYMSITIDNITYKGAFIVQEDESVNNVKKLTFTATGNNICVWGSKKTAYDLSEDMVDTQKTPSYYNMGVTSSLSKNKYIENTTLLSGIPYIITNRFSGKVLDLTNGIVEEGTNIQQWELLGGSPQQWRLVDEGDGYCRISSMVDEDMSVTIENGNVVLSKYKGKDNQLFKPVLKRGSYGLVSKYSDDETGLDLFEWNSENGGNIAEWTYWGGDCQLWDIEPVYTDVTEGSYSIRNLNSALYVTEKNNTAVQGKDAYVWNIEPTGDGYCYIKDSQNKALTVENSSGNDGMDIYLSEFKGSESQKFYFHQNDDGTFVILSAVSYKKSGFDVYNISLEEGANICQWNYWGGNGQKFILLPREEIIKGDVNLDKEISNIDVSLILKFLNNKTDLNEKQKKAAHVNDDENIDILDAVALLKK